MKVKFLFLLSLISLGMLLSSCAIQTPIATMEKNYEKRMTTSEELTAKAHIKIFYNEKDVPCDYSIISLIKYEPLTIPIIMTERGKMNRKFLKKAVMKAESLGADAIIVQGMGFAKAITAPELKAKTNLEEDDFLTIGASYIYEQFADGTVATLSKKEKTKLVNALLDEVKKNIDDCKSLQDVAYIAKKIDALENYYQAEGKKNSKLKDFREDLEKAEAKIIKKEKRAQKIAESKAKVKEKLNSLNKKEEAK